VIRAGSDRGSVVAEFAVALPAVVIVLALGIGLLSASARHVRLHDAAADAARLAARGESDDRVFGAVGDAVAGASAAIQQQDDLVCVTATASAAPLPLLLSASSCALAGGR
jgi:Flp pilus assembly protein TadG